ncbi:DNA-processing protein DprA [Myceligenerans crystallogenes]|uniref:DNA-processing protein DprA n=1 Tax=Myceligenerans crystallogenes TaxID=316335 RepID=A0ABP4ZWR5_9MICO
MFPRLPFDVGDPLPARAAWSRLAEPGDVVAGALVAALGPGEALDWVVRAVERPGGAAAELARVESGRRVARALGGEDAGSPAVALMAGVRRWASRLGDLVPARDLETVDRLGGTLLVPGDPRWPEAMDDLGPAAPFALWVRGQADLARASRRAVALVGSRASTSYGERVARDLASGLVTRGFTVVSGGAHGIDAEAHRATLAGGGRTLVLLASGVDRLYPEANRRVMEAATADGALVAEVPPGSTPFRQRFLARNRLIAALGSATVVVEAALRSGALSTANHADRLLRPLGAVPGPVTSMASAGCHELMRSGAAVCVTDAAEAAELAGDLTADAAPDRAGDRGPRDGLDPVARKVLDALPVRRAASLESVARVAGLGVEETTAKLGRLLLAGLAEREGANWRCTRR